MEKIKVKIKVNDYNIENSGIIENDILKVKDGKIEVTFDLKNLIMTRENEEISIKIDFSNKTLEYRIPEIEEKFVNNFTILSLTNSDKEYNIKYQMEEDVFTLDISYENVE